MKLTIAHAADMSDVWRLTHKRYTEMGYCQPQPNGMLKHYPDLDETKDTTVVIARDRDGRLLGTCSYTLDGPAGLHTDKSFPVETSAVRGECLAAGLRLASSWRIVTREPSIPLVRALCRRTAEEMLDDGVDACLFTFNPRHAKCYQRLIGARVIAESAGDPTVANAPAVLMRTDRRDLAEFLERSHES